MREQEPVVIVCQGPPACDLEGDEAIEAQEGGCLWCKRIILHEDGTETVTDPADALQ